MMKLLPAFVLCASLLASSVAGFGVTTSGNSLIVDTEGGLIFTGPFLLYQGGTLLL